MLAIHFHLALHLCLHGTLHSELHLHLLLLCGIIKYAITNHTKWLNTKFSLTPVTLNLHNSYIPKSNCIAQNLLDILIVRACNLLLKSTNFITTQHL